MIWGISRDAKALANWYLKAQRDPCREPDIRAAAEEQRLGDGSNRFASHVVRHERDVDLVVSIGSIGTDEVRFELADQEREQWERRHAQYEIGLAVDAALREALLRPLVPVLGLQDRVTVQDAYAVIRGKRATYRLHLGSGGVYFHDSGKYLCIIADRPRVQQIYLPFEDPDAKTAVILSKLLLLANDEQIEDPSILRQYPRR